LWGCNQEMFLVGDPGAVSVFLFCPVESGKTDDNTVNGRNIVAKYQIYLYLVKSCVRRHHTDT
jgi:hypothetical protein